MARTIGSMDGEALCRRLLPTVPNPAPNNADGSINVHLLIADKTLLPGGGAEVVGVLLNTEAEMPTPDHERLTAEGLIATAARSGSGVTPSAKQTMDAGTHGAAPAVPRGVRLSRPAPRPRSAQRQGRQPRRPLRRV